MKDIHPPSSHVHTHTSAELNISAKEDKKGINAEVYWRVIHKLKKVFNNAFVSKSV